MCARCRNEGGDIDFTALPKRKKKGRPVMVSAYIPTEEEERLALEMDNIEAPTANMGSSTDVQSKRIAEHDEFIGSEGSVVNSEQDAVDVPTLMVTTSTITDDAQLGQTEETTIELIDEVSPTVEDIICDSNLSLSADKTKSVLVIQRTDTPALSTDADYHRWTEELLVQMNQLFTTRIVRTNSTEAPVLQQLVEEQLASLDVPVNAATTAPQSDTDAATMTSTASIGKELHHNIPIHLCCVGLPINDALSIWQQFPHTFDKLIIMDPPQQYVSKVDSIVGSYMPGDQIPNQQMTSPSNVLDEYNTTTTLVSNVVYSYLLPTAQLSLPYLMKLPLLRVSYKVRSVFLVFNCIVSYNMCAFLVYGSFVVSYT